MKYQGTEVTRGGVGIFLLLVGLMSIWLMVVETHSADFATEACIAVVCWVLGPIIAWA